MKWKKVAYNNSEEMEELNVRRVKVKASGEVITDAHCPPAEANQALEARYVTEQEKAIMRRASIFNY